MFQAGKSTIHETLEKIEGRKLVLPAIQREFVWSSEQICALFDSLMRGYPIGEMLYWEVEGEECTKWRWYDFMTYWHDRDRRRCEEHGVPSADRLCAVLDGQQRLTALNIGVRGWMAKKTPRMWWTSPDAFPRRTLHLLVGGTPNDTAWKHDFRFCTEEEAEEAEGVALEVGRIGAAGRVTEATRYARAQGAGSAQDAQDEAEEAATELWNMLRQRELVRHNDVASGGDDIVQIFVRLNSAGTQLSHADLLLAMATSRWQGEAGREQVQALAEDVGRLGPGLEIEKDVVLKAALVLTDAPRVDFRLANFDDTAIARIESEWKEIREAVLTAYGMLVDWGYGGSALRHMHPPLLLAYWIRQQERPEAVRGAVRYGSAREAMRRWYARNVLKRTGVWSGGNDTFLAALRKVVHTDGGEGFPGDSLEAEAVRLGRSTRMEQAEVEELLDLDWNDRRVPALLDITGMTSGVQGGYDIDHVWARTSLQQRKLTEAGLEEADAEWLVAHRDRVPNLQALERPVNQEKGTRHPGEWLDSIEEGRREAIRERALLGDVPQNIREAKRWMEERRALIRERLERAVSG